MRSLLRAKKNMLGAFCCVKRVTLVAWSQRHCEHCQCYKELRCFSSLQFFFGETFLCRLTGGSKDKLKPLKKYFSVRKIQLEDEKLVFVEIYFKIRALQEKQKQQTKKRHAECIKTFCLTIFVFFFGKEENKFYFILCCFSLENVFRFLAKSNKLSVCNSLCSLFCFLCCFVWISLRVEVPVDKKLASVNYASTQSAAVDERQQLTPWGYKVFRPFIYGRKSIAKISYCCSPFFAFRPKRRNGTKRNK